MKKTNFIMGIIASVLLIVIYISSMVSVIDDGGSGGQGAIMFVLLILAFVLLWLTYRARRAQTVANGVWTIIIGLACGFFPLTHTIIKVFHYHKLELIPVFALVSLSILAIIARGIMTLISKKNPYELDDFDMGAIVRERNISNITNSVFALLGGLANALIGIITLIEMFREDLFDSSTFDITAILIFILIFSFIGAIVLLFNRLQGGVYILTSSLLALLFASVSLAYQDQSAVLLILPSLALIASAVIGLRGYNKTKKQRADGPSISAGSHGKQT